MPNSSPLSSTQNGWNEYSRLVLKELETLSQGITNLNTEIQDIKREIALIKDREDKVEELREWKEKVNETITPTQLATLITEVQELKTFKTRAVTIWLIVQFIVSVLAIFRDRLF
jgi:predicted  nucleic acid-binding Zn-ribbon protein